MYNTYIIFAPLFYIILCHWPEKYRKQQAKIPLPTAVK